MLCHKLLLPLGFLNQLVKTGKVKQLPDTHLNESGSVELGEQRAFDLHKG